MIFEISQINGRKMSVPDNLLNVTGIRPVSRKTLRKASKVLQREDYDATLPTTQEARDIVKTMRTEIEAKEAQLNKLREMLARSDETDITQAQAELNRLQAAFAKVAQECENKLRPVQDSYNKELSILEGKKQFCNSYGDSANERKTYLEKLKQKTGTTVFNLTDPKVTVVTEKPLLPPINTLTQLQTDVGVLKRTLTLEKYSHGEMSKLNEALKRLLKAAQEEEKMANMNYNSAKQDIDVRLKAPKTQLIDDEWIDAKKQLDLNQFLLNEANTALSRINDEAKKIEVQNRQIVEDSRKLREELIILNRYMPNSDGNGSGNRAELTKDQIDIDADKARIEALNAKIKTQKGRLKPLKNKLEELPPKIQSEQKKLESLQAKNQQVEQDLATIQTKRSELMSEKMFGEDQYTTMLERVDEQSKRLAEITKRTEIAEETLRKQMIIMKLNDEMNNLKTMDFNRFTSVVSNLLTIQKEIEE